MAQKVFIFGFLAVIISICGAAETKCPTDYSDQSKTCMQEAGIDILGDSLHSFMTDPQRAKTLCESGKLPKAVECLDRIYKACSNHDGAMKDLSLTVSVNGWSKATKQLCDNVNLLTENQDCLTKEKDQSNICVNAKLSAYNGEIQAKALTSGALDTTATMGIACSYARDVIKCIKRPLTSSCPAKVSTMLSEVLQSLLPPACQPSLPSPVPNNKDQGYNTVSDNDGSSGTIQRPFTMLATFFIILICLIL